MDIVFGKQWFERHQGKLLLLLNSTLTKRWFRWVMRIRSYDCPLETKINHISPNSFTYGARATSEGVEMTTDFRTHEKFGKRLYHAFKPLWYAMHAWDSLFGCVHELDFGFSTLTAYPDAGTGATTVDGTVSRIVASETWATIIAGAGTNVSASSDPLNPVRISASSTSNQFSRCTRSIFTFDTSGIGAGQTISAAIFSLNGTAKQDDLSTTPDINVYGSTPAANNSLANADYGQTGSSAYATAITYGSWSTAGYNDFTFNGTGIAAISTSGVTALATRNANYDVAAVQPNWVSSNVSSFTCNFADAAGTSTDPKLVVTYSAASTFVPKTIMF